jgi:hypothetical protein
MLFSGSLPAKAAEASKAAAALFEPANYVVRRYGNKNRFFFR